MNELKYLDELSARLDVTFDFAVQARDGAQAAIESVSTLKAEILRRKIELQRAALEAATAKQPCPDCAEAARLAYSEAATPGFFNPKCSKHQTTKQPTEVKEGDDG